MSMLCRDADACYWIGRYIERAEATARTLDVHYHFGLESSTLAQNAQWASLLAISDETEAFTKRYDDQSERNILQFFGFDDSPGSIHFCLRMCRENARSMREQISSEMWESLNRTFLAFREWNVDRVLAGSPHVFFQWVKDASHLFQGITNRTLMMGESRDFLDAGRFLERADQTARILDVKYHDLLPRFAQSQSQSAEVLSLPPVSKPLTDPLGVGGPIDVHGWISVLKSVGAYEAFRKTYYQVTPTRVADFLILNQRFPASIRHSISRVDGCIRRVGGNQDVVPINSAEREIGKLSNHLNYITAEEVIADGLHGFLANVQSRCADIGYAISETYLRY